MLFIFGNRVLLCRLGWSCTGYVARLSLSSKRLILLSRSFFIELYSVCDNVLLCRSYFNSYVALVGLGILPFLFKMSLVVYGSVCYGVQRTCIGEFSPWTLGPSDSHLSPLGMNLLSLSFMVISQPNNQFLGTVTLIIA